MEAMRKGILTFVPPNKTVLLFEKHTNTYGNWVIWKGFQKDGSPKPAIDLTKKVFKCYPLSQKDNPPALNFVNVSGVWSA
jgi:hypothetical protein